MSMTDPIADMLTRIRNAQMTERAVVVMPVVEGQGRDRQGAEGRGLHRRLQGLRRGTRKPQLEIALKLLRRQPVIEKIERVSKPGLRIYKQQGRHSDA